MKTPTIQWSQNDTYIFLDIQLEPKDYEIKIQESSLVFKQGEYEVNMTFFKKIKSEESKYNKNRIFEFYLKKEEEVEWKQLLENKNQYNVSINWDKFDMEDDELPDMDGMPDMSSMMGGMPGDFADGCCNDENCDGCDDEILENFEISDDEEDGEDGEDNEDNEKNKKEIEKEVNIDG